MFLRIPLTDARHVTEMEFRIESRIDDRRAGFKGGGGYKPVRSLAEAVPLLPKRISQHLRLNEKKLKLRFGTSLKRVMVALG